MNWDLFQFSLGVLLLAQVLFELLCECLVAESWQVWDAINCNGIYILFLIAVDSWFDTDGENMCVRKLPLVLCSFDYVRDMQSAC